MGQRIEVFAWRFDSHGGWDEQIYGGNSIVAALLVAMGARLQGEACVTIKWRRRQ